MDGGLGLPMRSPTKTVQYTARYSVFTPTNTVNHVLENYNVNMFLAITVTILWRQNLQYTAKASVFTPYIQ
jgi:hypothetical protein